jgi:hypothetical protein
MAVFLPAPMIAQSGAARNSGMAGRIGPARRGAAFYAHFMEQPVKRHSSFTPRFALLRGFIAIYTRVLLMADILFLGVALIGFAVLALCVVFADRL